MHTCHVCTAAMKIMNMLSVHTLRNALPTNTVFAWGKINHISKRARKHHFIQQAYCIHSPLSSNLAGNAQMPVSALTTYELGVAYCGVQIHPCIHMIAHLRADASRNSSQSVILNIFTQFTKVYKTNILKKQAHNNGDILLKYH